MFGTDPGAVTMSDHLALDPADLTDLARRLTGAREDLAAAHTEVTAVLADVAASLGSGPAAGVFRTGLDRAQDSVLGSLAGLTDRVGAHATAVASGAQQVADTDADLGGEIVGT